MLCFILTFCGAYFKNVGARSFRTHLISERDPAEASNDVHFSGERAVHEVHLRISNISFSSVF